MGEGDFVALDINIDKNTQKKDVETNLDFMAKKLGFIQVSRLYLKLKIMPKSKYSLALKIISILAF